jgi:hypothetical protein
MKKVGEYTAKGQFTSLDNTGKKIHLFDGSFKSGYRVTKFFVATTAPTDANEDCVAVLATEPNLSISNAWDWSDNRQIAWASNNSSTGTAATPDGAMIDPDNLIVEDLYVYGRYDDGGTGKINYMIHLEKYDISEGLGALALVRNNSQNVE